MVLFALISRCKASRVGTPTTLPNLATLVQCRWPFAISSPSQAAPSRTKLLVGSHRTCSLPGPHNGAYGTKGMGLDSSTMLITGDTQVPVKPSTPKIPTAILS